MSSSIFKISFLLSGMLSVSLSFAQTFPGPQEPQWKFWLAFEDSTQARDTVWFGLDETGTWEMDSIFGESPITDTLEGFRVYFKHQYDSSKVFVGEGFIESSANEVFSVGEVYPIKVSWDTSLFGLQNLSFPIWFGAMSNHYFFDSNFMDLRDKDSIVLVPDGQLLLPHFPMLFVFDPYSEGVSESPSAETLFIYPNPSNHFLNLECDKVVESIEILGMNGRSEKSILVNSSKAKIPIGDIIPGVYILKIKTKTSCIYEKFIKH